MAELRASLYPELRAQRRAPALAPNVDVVLLVGAALLVAVGLVMVASASVAVADRSGSSLSLLYRQAGFAVIGACGGMLLLRVPMAYWRVASTALLMFGCFLLLLVLVPGVGVEVNGSTRWLPVVLFNLQVSELARVCVLIYLAGFLVRHREHLRESRRGFLAPMAVLGLVALLLLMEPDFGAAVVITTTGMAMLFMAGAPLGRFLLLALAAGAGMAALLASAPYRMARFMAFLDPWADPYNTGFQLTQALIAVGRGGAFGVGLGNSVQKLYYLPEAHTDFLFAVLAEELGLVGVLGVILLYGIVVWRIFLVASESMAADRPFGAYLAWGAGFWFGLQAFVNMGVNLGLLPTKGLTLPLISYGGSSLVMSIITLALVLRVGYEARVATVPARALGPGGDHE